MSLPHHWLTSSRISLRIFCTMFLMGGCATPYVVPTRINAPLMERPGNTYIDVSYGTSGFSGSFAVSPMKHFAVQAAYSRDWPQSQKDVFGRINSLSHGHVLREVAAGCYLTPFRSDGIPVITELNAGVADGTVEGGDNRTIDGARAKEIFVQLNLGRRETTRTPTSDLRDTVTTGAEYGTSFRFSNWRLLDITHNGIAAPNEKQESNFLRASAFGRWPGRVFSLELQGGVMFCVSDQSKAPRFASLYLSCGMHLYLFP